MAKPYKTAIMELHYNQMLNIMKYLLSILTVLSIGLFASCGGETESHDHNGTDGCCGTGGECCKPDEGNSSE